MTSLPQICIRDVLRFVATVSTTRAQRRKGRTAEIELRRSRAIASSGRVPGNYEFERRWSDFFTGCGCIGVEVVTSNADFDTNTYREGLPDRRTGSRWSAAFSGFLAAVFGGGDPARSGRCRCRMDQDRRSASALQAPPPSGVAPTCPRGREDAKATTESPGSLPISLQRRARCRNGRGLERQDGVYPSGGTRVRTSTGARAPGFGGVAGRDQITLEGGGNAFPPGRRPAQRPPRCSARSPCPAIAPAARHVGRRD